jgi:hypothetical protein
VTRVWGLAAAFLAVGFAVAGYFIRRGPSVAAVPVPYAWSSVVPDAGEFSAGPFHAGVAFDVGSDVEVPMLRFGVLRREDAYLVLDDVNAFQRFVFIPGGVLVAAENETEGPGPSIELFRVLEADAGVTKVASLPKPNYLATLEDFTVKGDRWDVRLSLDSEVLVGEPWTWSWYWPVTVGPGDVLLTSKNGGRTWLLHRNPPPPE